MNFEGIIKEITLDGFQVVKNKYFARQSEPVMSLFPSAVAFNAAANDWGKDYEDADILKIGYDFYFADEDWGSDTKVWEYISHKPHKVE